MLHRDPRPVARPPAVPIRPSPRGTLPCRYGPRVSAHRGTARFESLDAWLHTEIRGSTLADEIDDAGYAALLEAARHELADLAGSDGVAFDVSALTVSGPPRKASPTSGSS